MPKTPVVIMKNPSIAVSDHETKVQGRRPANGTEAALGAVVLSVRVVETGDPLGVTLAGEKAQLEAAGNPLQANVTVEITPFMGTTEMVNVAL